jgi:streptogramin lyase
LRSLSLLFVSCAFVLSGCSAGPAFQPAVTPSSSTRGAAIAGRVHGGQSPISGAHVYLYAVNDIGYAGPGIAASSANTAASLLTSSTGNPADGSGNYYVTTGSDGSFSITGDYTCSATTPNVYLLAVGGNPGTGSNNSAIVLAAGLGPCSTLTSATFVTINEISTVAAAYAAAGFATDPTHVSSSNSTLALRGVENALAAIVNLETISTGVANTVPLGTNGIVPQAAIDTLANILAACVNSAGPSSSQCTTLFANAKNGSSTPTDTGTAILNIAHNPGANIASLFALQGSSPPFIPDLSAAPNDFAIAIYFTGGGMEIPYDVAIDAKGNVWVANQSGDKLSELDPVGVPLSVTGYSGGGLAEAWAISIDSGGNVWVANQNNSTSTSDLSEFSSTGTAISTSSGYTGGGIDGPRGMTIDKNGNIWVTNRSATPASLSEFSATGSALSGSGFTGGGLTFPWGIATDLAGNLWVANKTTSTISEFSASDGTPNGSSPISGGGLGTPVSVAVDASGNIWVGDQSNTSDLNSALSKFSSSGTVVTGIDGYASNTPNSEYDRIAIDGNGSVWVADYDNGLCEFGSSGAAISGESGFCYYHGNTPALGQPWGLAIDLSGNVWVPDPQSGASGAIVEFVGAAAPIVTPVVANLLTPYGTAEVNRP